MIIDAHCDVLYQLWLHPEWTFESSPGLRINYKKWTNSPVKVQCFAIFVPDDVPEENQFGVALEMADLFYEKVIKPYPDVKLVTSKTDIERLKPDEKGAMLTLEGCHPIGSDLVKLKTLLRLGVTSVGITWNQANAVCDGIGEGRGAGLSSFGKEVIHLLNEEKVLADVSHISYQGFWDIMEHARYPIASHSNVYKLAPHRRNLDEEQLKALINRQAFIGVTFVPEFLTGRKKATSDDVIRHIEAIWKLGGENSIGFGSDFDGTSGVVKGIKDITEYQELTLKLQSQFSNTFVHKVSFENFMNNLPD
ncbi:MAG: membrane dipeptidase [Bacillaceae bacterium]|nr:membrane dipeptidase [Bacillaceae bacterium]